MDMNIKVHLVIVLLALNYLGSAQKIDHLVSFRSIENDKYFRFNYDNDFFAATDENYTQGYNFEFVAPVFGKNPLNFLLIKSNKSETKFGLALEHIGFTPNRYELTEIQFGDRPFAAAIMLRSFNISDDLKRKERWHSSLSVGLIGPGAFGEEMQVGIHKWTGNKEPLGWRHQIKNDLVLNYNVGFEKQILNLSNLFRLNLQTDLEIGTLFTNVSVGSSLVIGYFNELFSSQTKNKKFQIYAFGHPNVSLIGYDATLQGGLINRDSPYTITGSQIERFTFQFNYGLVIQSKTLYFEYSRSRITEEIKTGNIARWGGIKFGFKF